MRMGRVLCRSRPGWLFFDARSQPNCHQRSCMSYRHADSTRPILVYSFYNEKPVETRLFILLLKGLRNEPIAAGIWKHGDFIGICMACSLLKVAHYLFLSISYCSNIFFA